MAGSFVITTDRRCKLLHIKFRGFFSVFDLADYPRQKNAALARLGCERNDHVTLCDFLGCTPQSQEVMRFFAQSLDDPAHRSRRLAVVVDSMLTRLQVNVSVVRSDAACFTDLTAAKQWLFAEDADDLPDRATIAGGGSPWNFAPAAPRA